MKLAIYAGSFDPVTFGHLNLIQRAAQLFDQVIVAIGQHPTKKNLFELHERLDLRETTSLLTNVKIDSFKGLLAHYATAHSASVILRGVRSTMDLKYELPMVHANAKLSPNIETVFLVTHPEHSFISSSIVRELASHGADVSHYVPKVVVQALKSKLSQS